MNMRASILHKGLLLVLIPLVFEIVLVVFLFVVVHRAHDQTLARSTQFSELTAGGLANAAAMQTLLATMLADRDPSTIEIFRSSKQAYASEIQSLALYRQAHPASLRGLQAIIDNGHVALELLDQLEAKLSTGTYSFADRLVFARKGFDIARRFKEQVQLIRQDYLRQAALDREEQVQFRALLLGFLIVGVGISISLAIAMGFFFSRSIVDRLESVRNNTLLLAKEQPLRQVVGGQDELSELDKVLHDVADVIADARRRERAVVVNASDIICTVDESGIFRSMNPACARILGFDPDEVIGKPLSSLLLADEPAPELGKSEVSFEKAMLTKSGQRAEMLWAVRWSEAERAWFCVMHDITERKQAERFAQQVRNMVTHDIRAPLTAIIGSLQLVSSGRVAPVNAEVLEVLQTAEDSAQRLMTLCQDLLQLDRLASRKLTLAINEVSLRTIIDASVKSVLRLADQAQVAVKIELPEPDIRINVDNDRMTQVLVNLLSNAIKFSSAGGTVSVIGSESDGKVIIAVRDQGRGIPPESLERLFLPFHQVFVSDDTELGGTGLGLAICREIVELHHGSISVESEVGKGSTFFVELPR